MLLFNRLVKTNNLKVITNNLSIIIIYLREYVEGYVGGSPDILSVLSQNAL